MIADTIWLPDLAGFMLHQARLRYSTSMSVYECLGFPDECSAAERKRTAASNKSAMQRASLM
eukprot:scaffold376204_cov17-Prasinocladus_malaysianus.AAC.1